VVLEELEEGGRLAVLCLSLEVRTVCGRLLPTLLDSVSVCLASERADLVLRTSFLVTLRGQGR
jgi:hypothetical protein